MSGHPTPGRHAWRPGVFVSVLVLVAGCDLIGSGPTVQLEEGEVTLPRGAALHEVLVGGAGAVDSIAPAVVEARAGDVVRFVVRDHRTHAILFRTDSLSPESRQFLESTLQMRGPPLVNEGTAWVIALEGAPPGRYPFVCRAHDTGGVLTVRAAR